MTDYTLDAKGRPEKGHWDWQDDRDEDGNLREAVAVFETHADMEDAIDELERRGFSNAAISRPCAKDEIEASVGHEVHTVQEIEDDPSVPRRAAIDPQSRGDGVGFSFALPFYIFTLFGAGISASYQLPFGVSMAFITMAGLIGMAFGAIFASRITFLRNQSKNVERMLGGFLIWVRTGNREQEKIAVEVLERHHGHDVHLHGPARTA